MNIKTLAIAATLLLSAGASFAKTIDGVDEGPAFKSTLTRAQVQNDLRDAMANGHFTESGYVARMPAAAPSLSRNAVRGEAIASLKMHDMTGMYVGS